MNNKIETCTVGRPTKYRPDMIGLVSEYLQSTGREQTCLPSIEGLAERLGVTSETIRQWVKKYPSFSLTIKKLADRQKRTLMDDGMYGGKEVNVGMAIFLLKVNHGMNEAPTHLTQINIKPILGGRTSIDVQANDSDQKAIEA